MARVSDVEQQIGLLLQHLIHTHLVHLKEYTWAVERETHVDVAHVSVYQYRSDGCTSGYNNA